MNFIIRFYSYLLTTCSLVESSQTIYCKEIAHYWDYEIHSYLMDFIIPLHTIHDESPLGFFTRDQPLLTLCPIPRGLFDL